MPNVYIVIPVYGDDGVTLMKPKNVRSGITVSTDTGICGL